LPRATVRIREEVPDGIRILEPCGYHPFPPVVVGDVMRRIQEGNELGERPGMEELAAEAGRYRNTLGGKS